MYKIELNSPYFEDTNNPAQFNVTFNGNYSSEVADIVRIIRFISEDYQELKDILNQNRTAHTGYEDLKKLIEEYNTWIAKNRQECIRTYTASDDRASAHLIKYLMVLVYNRSILEPDKLNQYEPFSPEVYGETSFDLIESLLKRVTLKESDTFMDLGSGVGNIVLHVAAASKCKCCYGFEKAEWPSYFAVKMEREFKFWMKFFGKKYSQFKLYKADFLSDEEFVQRYNPQTNTDGETITMNAYVKDLINESNVIFVNNYAFGAEVDHQLKLRFCNMLEGSLIVSSKPFCSLNFRINSRNLNDIGTILNISEEPLNGKVSWTDRPINYYFHRIDRTLLEKYFERLNNPSKFKDDSETKANSIDAKHRKSTSSLTVSTSSDSAHSSAASSPVTSDSSLNSSGISIKKAKSVSSRVKSTENRSKISSAIKKKSKKRKNERSHSPDTLRKAKLIKKEVKSLGLAAPSRSKSLDKDVLKTLAKMHGKVANPNKGSLMHEFNAATDAALAQFNVKSLTTLKTENLDKKLLKDCKISPKLLKSLKKNAEIRSSSVPHKLSEKTSLSGENGSKVKGNSLQKSSGKIKKVGLNSNNGLTESEEAFSRENLGEDIMNAVDVFIKKMQKQYVKYLMHLKSSSYEEKIKLELKNELDRKKELLARKEKIEKLTSSLLKSNVDLLKRRVEELGIKNLDSPYQLIEYARKILADNKQLNKRIEIVQKKVNSLDLKQKQQCTAKVDAECFLEKSNSRLQSLDKLLRTIDSKYSNLNSLKKPTKPAILEEDSSARSDDGTLSATEKNDDDDQSMAELDEELGTIEAKNGFDIVPKKKAAKFMMSPVNNSEKYGQLLNGNRALDGWRSFKIPKQQKSTTDETDILKTCINRGKNITPVGSPTLSTSSSSSSTNNNRILDTQLTIPRQISQDSTSSSSSNSVNSSSKNFSDLIQANSNDKHYYHPKKKQFRQYMMENSNPKNQENGHHFQQNESSNITSNE